MNFATPFLALLTVVTSVVTLPVHDEQHIVRFDNRCGYGTPVLIKGEDILSTGDDYISSGPLAGAVAYLQTGKCGFNGENCTLLEVTLNNPLANGGGSSTDLSLIDPHAFSVTTGFGYFDGCDGAGASCNHTNCLMAFRNPNDTFVQIACQENNVNLFITFCE